MQIEDVAKKNYFSQFPDEETLRQSLSNSFIINWPMSKSVGGDGYWAYEKDDIIYLVVYDCMGHGHLASMATRIYTNSLTKVIVENERTIPGSILRCVHEEIASKYGKKQNTHLKTGADAGVVKIDRKNKKLEFAGAKMDLWMVKNGVYEVLKADRMQVGEFFDYYHEYNTHEIDLTEHAGTKFYLSSDGVKDLIGGPDDKKLGKVNLTNLLERNADLAMAEQKEIFISYFQNWMGSNEQFDDVLMVGFEL
ncbi:MAG: SpoIIE family protein phosphatase [Cyclobacteriaceae bacterium]